MTIIAIAKSIELDATVISYLSMIWWPLERDHVHCVAATRRGSMWVAKVPSGQQRSFRDALILRSVQMQESICRLANIYGGSVE